MRLPARQRRRSQLAVAGLLIALALTVLAISESEQGSGRRPAVRAAVPEDPIADSVPRRAAVPDPAPGPAAGSPSQARVARAHRIDWRRSRALGDPSAGSLRRGVMLPSAGRTWVSWDSVERDKPNRWWRRWGTDRLVRTTLAVIRGYAAAHPNAPRVLIGDMSRPHGGDFGARFGPIGHVSHQNGLDVDVYYPRTDHREWAPRLPEQVDVRLSQDLVDRFVAAGAEVVFVGPDLPLTGPPGVVVPLVNHDNHLHFRLPAGG